METNHNPISKPWNFLGRSLERPWEMKDWNPMKDSNPPWVHRDIWYHSGEGDYVVFDWRERFESWARTSWDGHIRRFKNLKDAEFCYLCGDENKVSTCDGVYLFHRYELLKQNGQEFPEELPGRWW
jgi:hypothetical protein